MREGGIQMRLRRREAVQASSGSSSSSTAASEQEEQNAGALTPTKLAASESKSSIAQATGEGARWGVWLARSERRAVQQCSSRGAWRSRFLAHSGARSLQTAPPLAAPHRARQVQCAQQCCTPAGGWCRERRECAHSGSSSSDSNAEPLQQAGPLQRTRHPKGYQKENTWVVLL